MLQDEINVVYSKCSMYENDYTHTVQVPDSANIYEYFSEVLKKDSEGLAIFHQNKLIKRCSSFQLQDNDKYYEIHLIQEMKENLNCYDAQIRNLQSIIANFYEQPKQTQNQQSLIIFSIQDNQSQKSKIIQSQISMSKQLSQKGRELENLNNRVSAILMTDPNLQSMIFEMKSRCTFCSNEIDGERLQTGCQHDFHLECFKCLIEAQIDTATRLICVCKKRLPHNILYLLKDYSETVLFFKKIYQNQLIQIQNNVKFQNLQVINCNKHCQFFYLDKVNKDVNDYCCFDCMNQ